jgi:hypothetical protein
VSWFDGTIAFLLIVLTIYTVIALGTSDDIYEFLRSMSFPAICAGYIILFGVFFMFKNVFREEY